jgi:hypothetical protein
MNRVKRINAWIAMSDAEREVREAEAIAARETNLSREGKSNL